LALGELVLLIPLLASRFVALEHAEELRMLMPKRRRQQRRRLKAAAAWAAEPARALQRMQQLEGRFDILLKRALRQRNAAIHGVDTVLPVIASVDGFITQLAARIIGQTIASAPKRQQPAEALEVARIRAHDILARLGEEGQTLVDILFPN
jgi:hypothetical protein